jgi:hypothetical protein
MHTNYENLKRDAQITALKHTTKSETPIQSELGSKNQ